MDRKWLPLNALRAFEAVGRHLSFTQGAQSLAVGQSAVSRHISALEDLLGHRLFERRPSGLRLTQAGASLLPAVTESFDRLEAALEEVRGEAIPPRRTLRLHLPPSFLQRVALPLLRELRQRLPDVMLDVATSHAVGDPAEEFDLLVVYDRPRRRPGISDLLWMVQLTPVCAPQLAPAGPVDLEAFLHGQDLLQTRLEGRPRDWVWRDFADAQGLSLDTDEGLAFDTVALTAEMAQAGAGVALVDAALFADDLASGRLVAPVDVRHDVGFGYFLVTPSGDLSDPALAMVREEILRHFANHDELRKPDESYAE
jgi:LysR family glycine cleavage system transcriptional activator